MLPVPVGHKPLQAANAHALALDAPDALALALVFLGADTAAHGGQSAGGGEHLIGPLKVLLGHLADEGGDVNAHGASGLAGLILAVQAALGLIHRHLSGVAQSDLVKVVVSHLGLLAGHGALAGVHVDLVCHAHCTSLLSRLQEASRAWVSNSR